jgi:hypothetical protein
MKCGAKPAGTTEKIELPRRAATQPKLVTFSFLFLSAGIS